MGVITKIEEQKNVSRVNIFVDGAFFCGLGKETAIIFGLKTGKEVDEGRLQDAVTQSEIKRAFEKGADYLAGRMHSKKELVDKLVKKGFCHEVALSAVAKLEEYSYVDDRAFAKVFVQTNSKYSRLVLRQKLASKGVDKAIIDEVLAGVSGDDELEICKKFACKYAKSHDTSTAAGRQKLFASLARREFDFDTIKAACKNLAKDDEFLE